MAKLYTSLFATIIFCSSIWAQQNASIDLDKFYSGDLGFKDAKKSVSQGDAYFVENLKASYKQALEFYLKAYEYNSNYAPLSYKIGVCFLKLQYKKLSLPYLEKAYKLNPQVAEDISFQLGKAYQFNYQIDKAIEFFNMYKNSLLKNENPTELKKVLVALNESANATEMMKKPVDCFVQNMGNHINSHFSEYSPVISADESDMLFTARRNDTQGGGTDADDDQYFEDIYQSHHTAEGWTVAVNAGNQLNTKNHDATVSLSADGQHLILFRNTGNGDLYESFLDGDTWTTPKAFSPTINTPAKEGSACYSSDGKTLYFTSERKDLNSFGGSDIFVSKKDADGEWSTPKNLGSTVNTEFDEVGVYLMPDNRTLYFSSNNTHSMGGFDIFKTYLQGDGTWTSPENLGYPINTPEDDVFFQITADGKHAYYSSSRKDSYGDVDIYKISYIDAAKGNTQNLTASLNGFGAAAVNEISKNTRSVNVAIIRGIVSDAISTRTVRSEIEIYDAETKEKIQTAFSNKLSGKYLLALPTGRKYQITFVDQTHQQQTETFDFKSNTSYQEISKDIKLTK